MKLIYLLALNILFFSCSNGSDEDKETPLTNITITDVSENENASDIQLSFVQPIYKNVASYNVYIIPSDSIADSEPQELISSSINYESVSSENFNTLIRLAEATSDSYGNSIKNFIEYQILVSIIFEDTEQFSYSEFSNKLTLVNKVQIEKRWTGSLATSLFLNGFPINTDLKLNKNKLTGKVWFSNSTAGTHHATISMEISGKKLLNIYMNQITACGGSFSGSGTISSSSISMETPGKDCDGTHTWFKTNMRN